MSEETKVKDVSHEEFLEKAQSSYSEFDLPSGYLDGAGKLHKGISIREMTGEEEDILASGKDNSLFSVVERCVMTLGDHKQTDSDWRKILKSLPYSDHVFMLIRIRTVSLGRQMTFQLKCPSCAKVSNQSVDLFDFEIEGLKDPLSRQVTLPLDNSLVAIIHPSTVEDEEKWRKIPDPLSREILMRLTALDGNQPTLAMVKKMSLKSRRTLSSFIRKFEGKMDNQIQVECPHCNWEFETEVPIWDRNFFFPSEI